MFVVFQLAVLFLEVVSGDTCFVSIAVVCLLVCLFVYQSDSRTKAKSRFSR